MLDAFVDSNREIIIARLRERVLARTSPKPTSTELSRGVPLFLDQLVEALQLAKSTDVVDHVEIGRSARRHGRELLGLGLSIGQVVYDYGDVCQTVTELALEQNALMSGQEFKTLNLCLDDAIAEAVTAYASQRDVRVEAEGTEKLGVLAHELRNLLNTAMLAFDSVQRGRVAPDGATGLVLARSLTGLRDLIDRTLTDVRLEAGIERRECMSVAKIVEEIELGALLGAHQLGKRLDVTSVDSEVLIEGDRQIITAAISNLLDNAFKFTRPNGKVALSVSATRERVLFEIEDECGGLPPGKIEDLFHAFEQRGSDRSGLGLGLSICLKAARANSGEVRVRDLPGKGCVFTFELPRA